jgi:hypothetical protein
MSREDFTKQAASHKRKVSLTPMNRTTRGEEKQLVGIWKLSTHTCPAPTMYKVLSNTITCNFPGNFVEMGFGVKFFGSKHIYSLIVVLGLNPGPVHARQVLHPSPLNTFTLQVKFSLG